MTSSTAAQDEFDNFIARNTKSGADWHPEDQRDDNSDNDDVTSAGSQEAHRDFESSRALRSKKASTPDSDADDAEQDDAAARATNMRAARYFLPTNRGGHEANTGPKGVIADAYAFETAKKKHRSSIFTSFNRQSATPAAPQAPAADKNSSEDDLDDDDDDDDLDGGFMAQWRQSRLQELRNQDGKRRASPRGGRRWGTVQTVDGEAYLDAVEKSGRDTVVLVLIYDDSSSVSNLIEQLVRQLARAHPTTRFVRMHYEEAEMEITGVPALLAYRNGDKFAGLVPVVDELPDDADVSAETLQTVLQRHQML